MLLAAKRKITLVEMNRIVDEDLKHIPEWPGDHQNYLRMTYAMLRKHYLGKKTKQVYTRAEVLREAIAELRKSFPTASFAFDTAYFA